MADTLEDGNDGPRPPIASNMSTASSALTELPESEAQQPSKAQDATDVDSRDFASSAMDVDADNTATPVAQGSSNLEIPDNKSESGTTASTDAHTANSTLDDMSTIESGNDDASMQEDSGASSTPNAYKSRIQARHDALRAGVPTYNSAQHYTFNSVYNIPQNTIQTHAIALPPCSSSLFTGGSDGYIRRYAWYASLRNHPSERHPILRGYWENLSITAIQARGLLWNLSMQEDPSRIRFGPAGISGGTTIPVHSLAVQADEMYCLAGSAEGVVNLYSVRLDEGQCRACLGITGKAHKRNSPVSALALSEKDATLLSGAWDKQILQWDLNAGGQCVRDFVGHKNPISSILFRPSSNDQGIPDIEWASAVEAAAESARSKAAEDNTKMASEQSKRSGTAPTIPQASTEAEADGDAEAASPASYDPLFDDDNNASRAASMSRLNSPNSTAMEVTNTTDSAAPSGGLTFPGLNIPSSSGLSLSSLLALGDSKAAENARVPTPAKLPVIDVPNIPSYTDRTQEQLAPFPPPSIDPENTDVFLSCSTDGECLLWDRRIDKGNVRKLDLPKGCPPWSVSAAWSPSGNIVYVGRRNAQVSVYDLRTSTTQTIHLPKSSGRITSLHPMRDNRHLLISSNDTVRLWNLEERNFTIVPSMGSTASSTASTAGLSTNGAMNSGPQAGSGSGTSGASGLGNAGYTSFVVDQREKYLFAACGNRGWLENGREEVGTFEIDVGR